MEDEYYVFATTLPNSWIGGDTNRVSEFYKLRWGHRKLIQAIRAAAAMDHQQQPFSTYSFVVHSVCTVQLVDDDPFHHRPEDCHPRGLSVLLVGPFCFDLHSLVVFYGSRALARR